MKAIELKNKTSTVVNPFQPYNFDVTVFKPSYYPDPLRLYEPGKFWFTIRFNQRIYGIKLENKGTVARPKVKITVFSQSRLSKNKIEKIIDELNFRFEFNRDISEFYQRFKNDKVLSLLLKRWYGMHGSCSQSLYGLLMIGIFLQNTIIKRSVKMTRDMLEKYGVKIRFDSKKIYEFWQPKKIAAVSEKELRKLKVGYRAKLFIKLSKTFVKEKINEFELRKLTKEEAKEKLLKLYGVGPETARIILAEALHQYDIFNHVAPWQQKIYSRLLFNKKLVSTGKIINYVNSQWDQWANLASHYIWEDIFWRRKQGERIKWLDKEIRL